MTLQDSPVTALILRVRDGDKAAFDEVYQLLYAELRQIAKAQLRGNPQHSLNTVDLINESYLKLIDSSRIDASGRAHFLALASRAMRQILVDSFRRRSTDKRGGGERRVTFDESSTPANHDLDELAELNEALKALEAVDERLARVVEYRFFGGMSYAEIGSALGIAARTARLDWRKAKAWLTLELDGS